MFDHGTIQEDLGRCRSALKVWLLSLPEEACRETASPMQASLRAIKEFMEEADVGQLLDLLFARQLVGMTEAALWEFCALAIDKPPEVEDMKATVELSLHYLGRALGEHVAANEHRIATA